MVTELLSKPKQSRQHLDIKLSNMGVTDEDAQMDLDLYIGNFDLKSIFLRRTRSGKNITSAKSILISLLVVLDFMESQKKHNTKLTTVT